MKTQLTLVASILLALSGCGDDGSSDDGATSNGTTSTGTTGSATGATSPTTDPTSATTDPTTDPTNGSSSGMADGSTSGMADGSTGTGGSGSTGGSELCEAFCAGFFAACGSGVHNDYGTEQDCVTACEGFDPDEFSCRGNHLMMVDGQDSVHCDHANNDYNCPG